MSTNSIEPTLDRSRHVPPHIARLIVALLDAYGDALEPDIDAHEQLARLSRVAHATDHLNAAIVAALTDAERKHS